MKEGDIIPVALEVTVRYKEGSTGLLVGFFREFPFITGQAKTFNELVIQLQHDLGVYFNTFPKGNEILKKYGRVVEDVENKIISEKNTFGQKAPLLEITRPEIGFEDKWLEEKMLVST